MFDGRVVLTSALKRPKCHIDDITTCMKAFSIYSLFGGHVWMAHDQVFREHAVASKLVDQSSMDVQHYNFHTAVASSFGAVAGQVPVPSLQSLLQPVHPRLYVGHRTGANLHKWQQMQSYFQ